MRCPCSTGWVAGWYWGAECGPYRLPQASPGPAPGSQPIPGTWAVMGRHKPCRGWGVRSPGQPGLRALQKEWHPGRQTLEGGRTSQGSVRDDAEAHAGAVLTSGTRVVVPVEGRPSPTRTCAAPEVSRAELEKPCPGHWTASEGCRQRAGQGQARGPERALPPAPLTKGRRRPHGAPCGGRGCGPPA